MNPEFLENCRFPAKFRKAHRQAGGAAVYGILDKQSGLAHLGWAANIDDLYQRAQFANPAPVALLFFHWINGDKIAKRVLQEVLTELGGSELPYGEWHDTKKNDIPALVDQAIKKIGATAITPKAYRIVLKNIDDREAGL
ncbi:MAG: hypothetical protein KDJ69_12240 [Nitratireductor sp.]|nr:hypothetical protein [Nitratireductor sp.]